MSSYVRFKEHRFESKFPEKLKDEFIIGTTLHNRIRKTWHMDKPVSCVYVGDQVTAEVSHKQMELLDECFHTYYEEIEREHVNVDGFLHISRYPELAEITATVDSAIDGLFYGFDNRDVASFIERESGEISESPEDLSD